MLKYKINHYIDLCVQGKKNVMLVSGKRQLPKNCSKYEASARGWLKFYSNFLWACLYVLLGLGRQKLLPKLM